MPYKLQLIVLCLLSVFIGCGPSKEQQYKETVQTLESEHKELDRIKTKLEATEKTLTELKSLSDELKAKIVVGTREFNSLKSSSTDPEQIKRIDEALAQLKKDAADAEANHASGLSEVKANLSALESELQKQSEIVDKLKAKRDALR